MECVWHQITLCGSSTTVCVGLETKNAVFVAFWLKNGTHCASQARCCGRGWRRSSTPCLTSYCPRSLNWTSSRRTASCAATPPASILWPACSVCGVAHSRKLPYDPNSCPEHVWRALVGASFVTAPHDAVLPPSKAGTVPWRLSLKGYVHPKQCIVVTGYPCIPVVEVVNTLKYIRRTRAVM